MNARFQSPEKGLCSQIFPQPLALDEFGECTGNAVPLFCAGRQRTLAVRFHAAQISVGRYDSLMLLVCRPIEPAADFLEQEVDRREPLLTVQNGENAGRLLIADDCAERIGALNIGTAAEVQQILHQLRHLHGSPGIRPLIDRNNVARLIGSEGTHAETFRRKSLGTGSRRLGCGVIHGRKPHPSCFAQCLLQMPRERPPYHRQADSAESKSYF